ncbi:MAG: helix-hairpin-helix domain-containing protein [Fimbriiglobus sp.]
MDGTTPPPHAAAPNPGPLPARAQIVLAVVAVFVLGMLAFRGSGSHLGGRPTDHAPAATRHAVDVNAADRAELLQIPGIGPSLADAILTHRQDRGPFADVNKLADVRGVGEKTLEKLRPWVTATEPVASGTAPLTEPIVERLERKPVASAFVPSPGSPTKLRPGDPPLDVNSTGETDLQRLPGIGPTLARRIVEARGSQRFITPDDLKRVKGIGPKTVESVRPYVVCR